MYNFKNNLKEDFLEGRKIKYVANLLNITPQYLSYILNTRKGCSFGLAYRMALLKNKDVSYYFVESEK